VQLFDPSLWLESDGTQVRYLTVREQADIGPKAFRPFIAAAAQVGLERAK
jgi:hypothetical protein